MLVVVLAGVLALIAWRPREALRPVLRVAARASEPDRFAVAAPVASVASAVATGTPPPARPGASGRCEDDAPIAASEPSGDGDWSDAPADEAIPASAPRARAASARFVAASRRIDETLRAAADPYARAVGLWLDLDDTASASDRERGLARMARESADPRIYALAFRACKEAARDDCANLSARRWAEIDPGNGLPWLHALDDATRRGDSGGVAEALFRMSTASRMEDRYYQPVALILDVAGDDEGSLAAAQAAAARAIGLSAAQRLPFTTVSQACGADQARADANLAQACRAIARLWQDHSDTLVLHMLGGGLELRVTGDASRRDAIRDEYRRLVAYEPSSRGASCRRLRENLHYLRQAARVGELAALRQRAGQAASAASTAAASTAAVAAQASRPAR